MAKRNVPTSLLEKGFKSYSRAIREITGWTQKEFETQKREMRYRVSNLNKLAGTNLSPIEELYYKVRYEDKAKYYASKGKEVYEPSPIQRALQDIKTTKVKTTPSAKQFETAKKYVFEKFEGLSKAYKDAGAIVDKLNKGEISPKEANEQLRNFANKMKVMKQENPTSWASAQDEEFGSP